MSSSIEERPAKTEATGSRGMTRAIVFLLLLSVLAGFASWGLAPGGALLTDSLSAPLDGATAARVDIDAGDGNLTVGPLTGDRQLLARGTLQYIEGQGAPIWSLGTGDGQASLTLQQGDAGQSWLRLPWAACNGATEWQLKLNPQVRSDIRAHSDGGNLKLDLTGMAVGRVLADTGGGNMDVVLPEDYSGSTVNASTGAGNVTVDAGSGITGSNAIEARSGAGNVVVRLPSSIAARVKAPAGAGKVTVDSRIGKLDGDTYQSSDYDSAANRVEITVHSGAGNVSVDAK